MHDIVMVYLLWRDASVPPGTRGQYDNWAARQGPMAMSYMTRDDVPYHCALADAFTVGDAYFCSVMGPTNPNRMYMWSGCIGNLSDELPLDHFGGWYDLVVKVSGDASFRYQLAGHVETGKESISDPALGGLVTLKG